MAAAVKYQPIVLPDLPKPAEIQPNWKVVLQVTAEIAIQVLAPLAVAFLLYLTLPVFTFAIVLPIAAISTALAMPFLFEGKRTIPLPDSSEPPSPIVFKRSSPRGIANAGMNCWVNALAQVIRCDQGMKEWFLDLPDEWDLIEQVPYFPPGISRNDQYLELLREYPTIARYLHFFAEVSPEVRAERWNALVAFQEFLIAYEEAEADNSKLVSFDSQKLRLALHTLLSTEISSSAGNQTDPMSGLAAIEELLPNDLKVAVEERKVYHLGTNPPIEGGQLCVKKGSLQMGRLVLTMLGDPPNLQEMIDHQAARINENSDCLVWKTGVDGVNHKYLLAKEAHQFVKPPPTLWLHIERWDEAREKIQTPLIAQSVVKVQPALGDPVEYELDSFIVHRGRSIEGGHYVSYKLDIDAEGNEVWFEMDNSRVRSISKSTAEGYSQHAYVFHYTRV